MANEWGTAGLVPGMKTRMTSIDLRAHMLARAEYHHKRHDEKAAQLPQIEEAVDKIKASSPATVVAQLGKGGNSAYRFDGDDAVESLKRDITDHNNKAVAFKFLAEHLFAEDYCLDRDDLVRLEILKP